MNKNMKIIILLIGALFIIGIGSLVWSVSMSIGDDISNDIKNNNTTHDVQKDNVTKNNSSNVFENQYIKFKIPKNITVQDTSSVLTSPIDVSIYENDTKIGSITWDTTTTEQDIVSQDPTSYTTAGKVSYEYVDTENKQIVRFLLIGNKLNDLKYIKISFDFNKQQYYDNIVKSLKIKSTP